MKRWLFYHVKSDISETLSDIFCVVSYFASHVVCGGKEANEFYYFFLSVSLMGLAPNGIPVERGRDKTETDGMDCSMPLFNFSFNLQLQLAFL